MSRSCFASFPICVYKFSSHYLNNMIFIDNSLGALARDLSCICLYIKAVPNIVMLQLYLVHALYDIIFIIKCKLYTASRSGPSTPEEKSLVRI